MADSSVLPAGPSTGELGQPGRHSLDPQWVAAHPGLARKIVTVGAHPRAGHDRARWPSVKWRDYAAHVGIQRRRGPWSVQAAYSPADSPDAWTSAAAGLPHEPGLYTVLVHDERGTVMSDLPAEVAGFLPFLDRVQAQAAVMPAPSWAPTGQMRILIGGLGLGIVPAWLLQNAPIWRIDIIEIDADVIDLIAHDLTARDYWSADPRLHIHHGDALTWSPGGPGCALHPGCQPPGRFDAAWWDIWDTVSAANLPSMHRLHRRFGRLTGWQMSWERAECEAMRARGQTLPHPGFGCLALEDGYA